MYPGKNPEGLAFSCVLFPILPPTYPKLTNMFVLSGQFADVGRTLGLHCRCLRMFPGRVTLFTDVPSLFADVLTKPADLAIGPHNRDSVNRALDTPCRSLWYLPRKIWKKNIEYRQRRASHKRRVWAGDIMKHVTCIFNK